MEKALCLLDQKKNSLDVTKQGNNLKKKFCRVKKNEIAWKNQPKNSVKIVKKKQIIFLLK